MKRLLRQVILLGVFLHHSPGAESRHEGDHRAADFLDPFARNPQVVPIKEAGNNIPGQHFVEVRTVAAVLLFNGLGMRIVTDGEAVGAIVALAPPAVENAEVEATVRATFHSAGAGGFERTTRIVEPHVTTGNHLPRDVHVIVLDEYQVALQVAVFAKMNDVLDVAFAIVVTRMRLAGEYELNGTGFVTRQAHDIFDLLENQWGTLVSGEAAGEADG